MYITIRKDFFDKDGTEYACAVDVNNIKVHKKFEEAVKFHEKVLAERKKNFAGFITNDPMVVAAKKNKAIVTIVEYTTGNGNNYKIVYQTTYKNYSNED